MWLRESDHTHLEDTVLYGKTFEDIQMILQNDREFMYPGNCISENEKMILRKIRLLEIAQKELMDSVRCAMETLEEYAEDLIKITAPREKVVDIDVKTFEGWMDSDVEDFADYVKENDKVDYAFVMHFADCVPPRTFNRGMIQCGEPHSHAKEGARYATFIYLYKDDNYGGEVWQYKGNCLGGTCEKGTEIPRV